MTSAPTKSVPPVNPQLGQLYWTYEQHNETASKSGLSTPETFGKQTAEIGIAELLRDETFSLERPLVILVTSLDSFKALLTPRTIDVGRSVFIQGHMGYLSADVLTSPDSDLMFGKGTESRTDVQTGGAQTVESVVREAVLRLLNVYAEDDFEPGFVSPLEREFCDLIASHGYKAIIAMQGELQANRAATSALAEMVRVFGRIREDSTAKARYEACVYALRHHPELTVRDAAALALCDLEDPSAIPALREAAKKETNALVRTSHFKIADWLELLPACRPSSEN